MKAKKTNILYTIVIFFLAGLDYVWGVFFLFYPVPLKLDFSDIISRILIFCLYLLSANALFRNFEMGRFYKIRYWNLAVSIVFRFVIASVVTSKSLHPYHSTDIVGVLLFAHAIVVLVVYSAKILFKNENRKI